MSRARDLLERANSLSNIESSSLNRLNMVHLVVSMRELQSKYRDDKISALRFGKVNSSKNELKVLFHYKWASTEDNIKCNIILEDNKSVEEFNHDGLFKLIHSMLYVSNKKCAPCKEINFNGITFKIMIYNEGEYSDDDYIFLYSVKFIVDVITNLFDENKLRDDLDELAKSVEERSSKIRESVSKSSAERKKKLEDLPEERRKEIEARKEKRAEAYKKSTEAKKELLKSITMLFDDLK